jgi:hypothetical protein
MPQNGTVRFTPLSFSLFPSSDCDRSVLNYSQSLDTLLNIFSLSISLAVSLFAMEDLESKVKVMGVHAFFWTFIATFSLFATSSLSLYRSEFG